MSKVHWVVIYLYIYIKTTYIDMYISNMICKSNILNIYICIFIYFISEYGYYYIFLKIHTYQIMHASV